MKNIDLCLLFALPAVPFLISADFPPFLMRQKAAALPVPGHLPLRANVNNGTNMFSNKKNKISELYLSLVDAHEAESKIFHRDKVRNN